jgi:hypothetical protein
MSRSRETRVQREDSPGAGPARARPLPLRLAGFARVARPGTIASLTVAAALAASLTACAALGPDPVAPGSGASDAAAPAALSLEQPSNQSLVRGETNRVKVAVRREGVEGDVALEVKNLPTGVEVIGAEPRIADGADSVELTLYAKPDADLVTGHAVAVTARAPDDVTATRWFHLDVRAN